MKKTLILIIIVATLSIISGCFKSDVVPTVSPVMSVSDFSPMSGMVGAIVIINGANFSTTPSANNVMFNGIAATVTSSTANQLIVTVPAGASSGAISVTVGSNSVITSSSFTVTTPTTLSIINFSPASAVVGTTVIIAGTNFSTTPANNTVKINGIASVVTEATASQLTVTVPVGATSGTISVTVGSETVTSSSAFTVLNLTNAVAITYTGTSATVNNPYENNGVKVVVTNGNVVVTSTNATSEVNYVLSGTVTKGSLKIYSEYKFGLVLNGVSITNDIGPAINIQASKLVSVVLMSGTSNTLIDGITYAASTEDQKGAFFCEGQLSFSGTGALSVTGNNKHAICSDDYINMVEGNITVSKAVSDAIHANDYFILDGGALILTSSGNGIECESGYVAINGGAVTITSVEEGISASYGGTDATITPYINIFGGVINVTTTGDKGNAIKSTKSTTVNTTGTVILKVSGKGAKGFKTGGDFSMIAGSVNITTSGNAYYVTADADIAASAGINCNGNMTVTNGTIAIASSGLGGKGITVDGTLVINGGSINITTTGGIYTYNSSNTSESKAIKSDKALTINGGNTTISSTNDGLKSEVSVIVKGGNVNVTKSVEGLEAPIITLNGGNVSVVSSDDALNATKGNGGEANDGSTITFGGSIVILSSNAGDPIDSNGNVVMTGGTVVVHGPQSQPEVAIDVNGTFNISGGLLIASGPNSGNMIEGTSTSSSQYTVLIKINSNVSAGTLFNIQNASGTSLVTFAPLRNTYYFVFSSSGLLSGSAYKVYTGGSCSGATVTNGLYAGGAYSGGTQKGSFTVSGKLTTVSL